MAGTIQSVSDPIGRTPANGDAICGTKPGTGENDPGAKSTELELVLGRDATQRLRSGQTARRPSKAKAKLAGLCNEKGAGYIKNVACPLKFALTFSSNANVPQAAYFSNAAIVTSGDTNPPARSRKGGQAIACPLKFALGINAV